MIDLMERLLIDYEDRETIGEQTSRYRKERRAAAAEITRLRAELEAANKRIAELEAPTRNTSTDPNGPIRY